MRGCTWRGRFVFLAALSPAGIALAVPLTAASNQVQPETGAPTPTRDGGETAAPVSAIGPGTFASSNVTLLGRVTPQSFSTNSNCMFSATNVCANDVWGYVSPCGREYAIIGLRTGTGFVDITDPVNPFVIGAISDANSIWSDMRTYGTYAYNVNESGGGMQIFNLSQIDPPTRSVTLVGSLTQSGLQTVHNLTLNTDSGYAYLCGSNLAGGRLIAVSLANPASPTIAGQAIDGAYVHDAEVVSYLEGPYARREIAFCYCGSAGLKIIDVTNKSNMFTISTLQYPDRAYTHQGRLSADRQHVFLNDELDELQDPDILVTTTRVVNVSDLANPFLVTTFTSGLQTIDHNLMVRGNHVFEANYTSGLRIFDASNVNNVVQTGWIDTYPFNNGLSFNGAWGVFVDFPSGRVVVSDIQHGLFILDPSAAEGQACPHGHLLQACSNSNPKPRHLSVSFPPSSVQAAIRVKLLEMPDEYAAFVGSEYWVDLPVSVPDQKAPGQTVWQSRLSCTPVYADWSAYDAVQIGDHEILPGATYEVRAVAAGCDPDADSSIPLVLKTAPVWGDVAGPGYEAPDGNANVIDVGSIVDVLKNIAESPDIAQTDLDPSEPDFLVNIIEVGMAVDAVKGFSYPFPGPSACP